MKINSEILIEKKQKGELKLSAILLFGNQGGMISGLTKILFNYIKKNTDINEIIYLDCKNEKNVSIKSIINNQSLFAKKKFIVITHISEKIYEELEKIELSGNIIIINGEGVKSNSKLKKFFDFHKSFLSVSCYELKRKSKIKIIDIFLSDNNIVLEKNAYWFLVENISNEYLMLEKELEKLSAYKNSSLSIVNLKLLLIQEINTNFDDLFFECAGKNTSILIKKTNSYVRSANDSYEIINNIKRMIQILTLASINKEIENVNVSTDKYLPKYLFMKKDAFKEILKNISLNKIAKITQLIQKTEVLLRKNSSHYFEITQRFILNFSKIIR